MDKPLCGPCDIGENTPCACDLDEDGFPKEAPDLDELEDLGQQKLFGDSEDFGG